MTRSRFASTTLAALDAAIVADPDRYEAIVADNQRAHAASGHWGVPTFVFKGEPFFGQQRIDLLLWPAEAERIGDTKRVRARMIRRRATRFC